MTNHIFKRYTLLFVSLFVNAFGVVLITKASLGTSPISGVPYVLSLATTPSFGFYTLLLNIVFMITEIVLMGGAVARSKRFELAVQIPVLAFFSCSIDASMAILANLRPSTYPQMISLLTLGSLILAAGIGWAVKADVAMNPGEYVVNIICRKTGRAFGTVKLCFDMTLVCLAVVLSLATMHNLSGLREGTLVAALLVGPMERMLYPAWRIFDRWTGAAPAHGVHGSGE